MIETLTKVFIRLFALYQALQGMLAIPSVVNWSIDTDLTTPAMVLWLIPIIHIGLAALAWFLAAPLSRLLVGAEATNASPVALEERSMERAGLVLLGVFTLTGAIPDLISHAFAFFSQSSYPGIPGGSTPAGALFIDVVYFLIGLGLVLGSAGISNLIHRLRTYGA